MRDPVSGLDPAAVAAQVQRDKHPQPAPPEAEAFKRGVEEGVAVAQRVAQPTLTLRQRLEALAGGPNLRVVVTPLAEMHLDEPAEPPRLCSGRAGDLFVYCGSGEILLQFWVGGRVTIVLVRDDEAGQLWDASLTKRGARPHAVLRLTVTG